MEKNFDIVFNSEKENGHSFQIANGYISDTKVLFERENIVAVINASGHINFYDEKDELLTSADAQAVDSGKGVYESVVLKVSGNVITVSFPVCEWIDNYPHCDGEHDRWDSRVIGYNDVSFDITNNAIL